VWRKLGVLDKMENAMQVERSGSAVLEELITRYKSVGEIQELILTSARYIWWMRRQYVHEERVPSATHAGIVDSNNSYKKIEER
jgi:hypothetical protein